VRADNYEEQLIIYATLYKLLGVIEHTLRARIPNTLRTLAINSGKRYWHEVIPSNTYREKTLRKLRSAEAENSRVFDLKISYGFWRHLFTRDLFTVLWLPALNKIFPNLKRPLTKDSYHEIGAALHRSYLIRNRVAHYDFKEREEFESEAATLIWLIAMLDVYLYLIKAE
jgi:hypothetical protein